MPDRVNSFFDWLWSSAGQLMLAYLAGATVSAIFDWRNPRQAARAIFIGLPTAIYLTPVAEPIFLKVFGWFGVGASATGYAVPYLMGVLGAYLVEVIKTVAVDVFSRVGKYLASRVKVEGGKDA